MFPRGNLKGGEVMSMKIKLGLAAGAVALFVAGYATNQAVKDVAAGQDTVFKVATIGRG